MKYTEVAAGYLVLSRDGRTHCFIGWIECYSNRIDSESQTPYVTWKQLEYIAFLQTMDIRENYALVLAAFSFESD